MTYWVPRSEYERNHFTRIRKFVEGIDLDTSFSDVSKMITSEMNRWQQKNGFWYTEENRPKPTPTLSPKENREALVGGISVAAIPFGLGVFVGNLAGFGYGFLTWFLSLVGGFAWVLTSDRRSARKEKPQATDGLPHMQGKVRTDLNASQKRALEAEARRVIRDIGVAHFKVLVESRHKDVIAQRRQIAKQTGLFNPALKPGKQQFGVSDEGAESLVAQWMRWLGVYDAEVTKYVGDGGIDVESRRYIAQVKNFNGNVGIASIRELAGVAAVDGRTPLFFTSGVYPRGADSWAQDAGIYLFTYDAKTAKLSANNQLARDALGSGLPVFDD